MYKYFIVLKSSYPDHDERNHYRTTSKLKQTTLYFDNVYFWNGVEVVECPRDGHCFVYAVVGSYNSTVDSNEHIEEMELNLIKSHTTIKPQLYTPYIEEESLDILFSKIRKYIVDKCFWLQTTIRWRQWLPSQSLLIRTEVPGGLWLATIDFQMINYDSLNTLFVYYMNSDSNA